MAARAGGLLAALALSLSASGFPQPVSSVVDRPTAVAARLAERPTIDGALDEPFWTAIEPVSAFKQRVPNEGAEPSERTEVRIAFDEDFLYFGITLFDSEPHRIRRTVLQRDGRFDQDDRFVLGLDTYFDHRNAYVFDFNPLGAQGDAMVTDEGRVDWNWEAVYWTEVRVSETGWVAEVAIPFATLRYPDAAAFDMGIAFYRSIRRKNEEAMWPLIGLQYRQQIFQVSQYARLTGLRDLRRHRNLEIKPYVLAGRQTSGGNESRREVVKDLGVDVKYGVTPNFTVDLTYNTDFAQVEADDVQINLTRFNLFFPERREFFLERSGLFAFGNENEAMLFFSRRIGITQPILGGVRVAGRSGPFSVGALNIQTGRGNQRGANFAVARGRTDLNRRTTAGAIVTNVTGGGDFNRTAGGDLTLRFWGSSELAGWISRVWTPVLQPSRDAGSARLALENDTYNVTLDYLNVGRNFDPGVGFVQRRDMIRYRGSATFSPRVGRGDRLVRQLFFHAGEAYIEGQDHDIQSRSGWRVIAVDFESGDEIGVAVEREFDRLRLPFALVPGVQIPVGDYQFMSAGAWVNTNTGRRFFGGMNVSRGGFYGGEQTRYRMNASYKLSKYLSVGAAVDRNTFRLPVEHGRFSTTLAKLTVFTAASRNLFANSLIQYNSVTRRFETNIRLDWIHTPGSDLFVVFNTSRGFADRSAIRASDAYAAVAKLTYLLAF